MAEKKVLFTPSKEQRRWLEDEAKRVNLPITTIIKLTIDKSMRGAE